MSGIAARSWTKNRWPPSYSRSVAPGICDAIASLLAGGAMPS